jgi:hypothetical protein
VDVAQLLEPVLTGGIKDTYFFNGRILTADDLRTMQAAGRQHDAQLGRAIGDGVAYGLELTNVSAATDTDAILHITPGLALNRFGDRVALAGGVDVALVRSLDAAPVDGLFTICIPPSVTEFTNLGLYLFTIAPASGLEGRAPMTELGTEGVGSKCGSRYEVEGVTFDCRPVTLPGGGGSARVEARALYATLQAQLETLPAGTLSPELFKLRNIVAHLCFGSDLVDRAPRDPLAVEDEQTSLGWLSELRNQKLLTDCEVPLGLLYWSKRGVEFVDMWAVRRRISIVRHPHRPYSWLLAPRRIADAEARLKQFQDEIEALRVAHPTPETLAATSVLRYLPPAGFFRVAGGAAGKAFSHLSFLQGIIYRDPVFIDGDRLEPLMRSSLQYPAFDLEDPTMVWLYAARENSQAIASGVDVPPAYLVVTTGQMPYHGAARFDVSQWDYANLCAEAGDSIFA